MASLGAITVQLRAETGDFSKGIDGAIRQLGGLAKSGLALGAAMGAVGGFFAAVHKSLKAQAEQESAINKLNLALANQGNLLPGVSDKLQNLADRLQDTTTFSDEAVLGAEGILASFGMMPDKIEQVITTIADFAAATGTDLSTAANLMGKAFVGSTAMLSRYGIVVDENLPKSERFDAALAQLQRRFGGSAAAEAATYTGQLKQLGNAWDEVQQAFGKFVGEITGGGGQAFAGLREILTWLKDLVGRDMVLAWGVFRASLFEAVGSSATKLGEFLSLFEKIPGIGPKFAAAAQAAKDFGGSMNYAGQEIRQQAVAASLAAGKTQEFANGTKQLTPAQKEAAEAAKKHAAEIKKLRDQLSGGALAKEIANFNEAIAGQAVTKAILDRAQALAKEATEMGQTAKGLVGLWQQVEAGRKAAMASIGQGGPATSINFDSPEMQRSINGLKELERIPVGAQGLWTRFGDVLQQEMENAGEASDKVAEKQRDWNGEIEAAAHLLQVLGGGGDNAITGLVTGMQAGAAASADLEKSMEDGYLTIGEMVGAVANIVSGFNQATDSASGLSRALGGAAFGARIGGTIGGMFGPIGQAIGSVGGAIIGGIAGLFRTPRWVNTAREAGRVFGRNIGREMAEQIQQYADQMGVSITQAAKHFKLVEDLEAENKRIGAAEQAASTIMAGVKASAGKLQGAGAEAGRIFATSFQAVVATQGIVAAVDQFKEAFGENLEGVPEVLRHAFAVFGEEGPARDAALAAQGFAQQLAGIAAAGYLTRDMFADFGTTANAAFQQALAGGATEHDALLAIAPLLANIQRLHQQTGMELDANTQRLLDQAEAAGIAFPVDPLLRVVEVLEAIAQKLGADIPNAAGRAGDAIRGIPQNVNVPEAGDMSPGEQPGGRYAGGADFMARSDGYFKYHRGERVAVAPAGASSTPMARDIAGEVAAAVRGAGGGGGDATYTVVVPLTLDGVKLGEQVFRLSRSGALRVDQGAVVAR